MIVPLTVPVFARNTYLDLQLEAVERHRRRGVEEGAEGWGGELDKELMGAGNRLRDGNSCPAELEEHRVSSGVAIVHRHVVLHLVALLPHLAGQSPV